MSLQITPSGPIVPPPMPTDDTRYAQLAARDGAADGAFVYGVTSTGIFCRPSCPSRTPRRENVRFFADAAAAGAAGFRPCRRCHPDRTSAEPAEVSLMRAMAAYIEDHADEPLTLARLADQAGMSPSHFQRRFKAVIGVSAKAYQAAARLQRLKAALRAGEDVLGATFAAGYGAASRVYAQVDGSLGMTPAAYRAGGAGERIGHVVRDTALGPLMMAATDRGVCFVQFGESEAALREQLAAEFPRALLEPAAAVAGEALDAWMAALAAHLAEHAPSPTLPLDLRGTAFQIRVWRFLMRIPSGTVTSYAELAAGIGQPRAVRAAARACAANRVALLVPCHRVLRGDGSLGGYRWGVERKRALIDAERRARR
jgi:AraC family transcriptional regulator of adaptative response/methylated-DNA-[protein]-cysteine methyltransferase